MACLKPARFLHFSHVAEKNLNEDEELKIVDEHMGEVPLDDDSVGALVVRSPWLTYGSSWFSGILKIYGLD